MIGGQRPPASASPSAKTASCSPFSAQAESAELAGPKLTSSSPRSALKAQPAALALARKLRHSGLTVELGDGSFRLKKSFEIADKQARNILILGEDELKSGILTVKNFSTGIQTKVPRAELAHLLAQPA